MLNMAAFETPSPKTLARAAKVKRIVLAALHPLRPKVIITPVGHHICVKAKVDPKEAGIVRWMIMGGLNHNNIDASVDYIRNNICVSVLGV